MGVLAFVFPGQGSQAPGMGQALYLHSPAARQLLDQAESLMPGLLSTCFEGSMEALTRTDTAQPALFAICTATAAAAVEAGLIPQAAAGFSLGEWTAIAAAGLLPFEAAFSLVKQRGAYMQACAAEHPGGMAAVLRMSSEELAQVLRDFPAVWPVNYNSPEQTVVAASMAALDQFMEAMKAQGRRVMKLNVSGAFHSPLMKTASEQLSNALRGQAFNPPTFPVYSNVFALPYTQDRAAATLAAQVQSPVQWVRSIQAMVAAGVDSFLELGPGKVLSGLIGKIAPEAKVYQAEDVAGLQAIARQIGAQA